MKLLQRALSFFVAVIDTMLVCSKVKVRYVVDKYGIFLACSRSYFKLAHWHPL